MLLKFELLKILRKKSAFIVMAVSLILTGLFFGMPVIQYQTYNQDGLLKGAAGIAYEKKQYAKLAVPFPCQKNTLRKQSEKCRRFLKIRIMSDMTGTNDF